MHEHDRPLLLRTRAILTPSASLHRRADDKPVRWASQSQKRHARWRERDVIRTSMKASKGLKTDRGGGASEADPCHAYLFDSSPQLPSRRAAELRHGGPSCRRALAATIPADFPKTLHRNARVSILALCAGWIRFRPVAGPTTPRGRNRFDHPTPPSLPGRILAGGEDPPGKGGWSKRERERERDSPPPAQRGPEGRGESSSLSPRLPLRPSVATCVLMRTALSPLNHRPEIAVTGFPEMVKWGSNEGQKVQTRVKRRVADPHSRTTHSHLPPPPSPPPPNAGPAAQW